MKLPQATIIFQYSVIACVRASNPPHKICYFCLHFFAPGCILDLCFTGHPCNCTNFRFKAVFATCCKKYDSVNTHGIRNAHENGIV